MVNVFATVRDKKGQILNNLNQDDFSLTEDGRPQAIRCFLRETELPLTLGLLVDTSGSERRVIGEERDASDRFLVDVLRPDKDQAFVLHFDREVELLEDLTNSLDKLPKACELLEVNSGSGAGRGGYPNGGGGGNGYPGGGQRGGYGRRGGTDLYDAVYLAANDIMSKQKGRKAVVMLSDGRDTGSRETLRQAIESAQRADMIVYTIYYADEQGYSAGEPG